MHWLVKAATFKVLSAVPGGAALYRFGLDRLTGAVVPTRARVGQKLDVGLRYWDVLAAHRPASAAPPATHLDFGAGWNPTIPFLYYSLGVERQWLFDIAPVLTPELMAETLKTFLLIVNDPQWPHRSRLRRLPELHAAKTTAGPEWLAQIGITYRAPYAGHFQEVAGQIGLATCTQVLLYIDRDILRQCFTELHQSLKPGGQFLATIHLTDLRASPGNGISKYDNLRFSPDFWGKWVNCSLMSFNRLKAPDYRQLLEEAGFKIVHFEVEGPTAEDLAELKTVPVHPCFSHYSQEELGAKHLLFMAEKT